MDTIVVAGKASGIGKTSLICRILTNLRGSSGVIKAAAGEGDLEVITNNDFLHEDNTDTARFLENGADKAVFIRTAYDRLGEGLEKARGLLGEKHYLLIEGNSVLDYLNPELIIYLDGEEFNPKPSAARAKARADIIIKHDDLIRGELLFTFNRPEITCYKAHLIAGIFGQTPGAVGKVLNKEDIKVRKCQLGLF